MRHLTGRDPTREQTSCEARKLQVIRMDPQKWINYSPTFGHQDITYKETKRFSVPVGLQLGRWRWPARVAGLMGSSGKEPSAVILCECVGGKMLPYPASG